MGNTKKQGRRAEDILNLFLQMLQNRNTLTHTVSKVFKHVSVFRHIKGLPELLA